MNVSQLISMATNPNTGGLGRWLDIWSADRDISWPVLRVLPQEKTSWEWFEDEIWAVPDTNEMEKP